MQTKVIFRIKENEVFALFPYDIFNSGLVASYAHIGQHSSADYSHCIRTSKAATPEQYSELKAELEGLGYELKVISKAGRAYIVYSPDGFPISCGDLYSSKKEAEKSLREWIENYRAQGYYSSNSGRIELDELFEWCSLERVK